MNPIPVLTGRIKKLLKMGEKAHPTQEVLMVSEQRRIVLPLASYRENPKCVFDNLKSGHVVDVMDETGEIRYSFGSRLPDPFPIDDNEADELDEIDLVGQNQGSHGWLN